MIRVVCLALAAAALVPAASKKKPKSTALLKMEVVEATARRTPDGRVEMDGRILNSGQRTIEQLVLIFRLTAPSNEVITTQRGKLDTAVLEPGEEAEFHWQMRDHARAVKFQVEATDRYANQLTVEKPGPYPIE
jgi:hypothetical protein